MSNCRKCAKVFLLSIATLYIAGGLLNIFWNVFLWKALGGKEVEAGGCDYQVTSLTGGNIWASMLLKYNISMAIT